MSARSLYTPYIQTWRLYDGVGYFMDEKDHGHTPDATAEYSPWAFDPNPSITAANGSFYCQMLLQMLDVTESTVAWPTWKDYRISQAIAEPAASAENAQFMAEALNARQLTAEAHAANLEARAAAVANAARAKQAADAASDAKKAAATAAIVGAAADATNKLKAAEARKTAADTALGKAKNDEANAKRAQAETTAVNKILTDAYESSKPKNPFGRTYLDGDGYAKLLTSLSVNNDRESDLIDSSNGGTYYTKDPTDANAAASAAATDDVNATAAAVVVAKAAVDAAVTKVDAETAAAAAAAAAATAAAAAVPAAGGGSRTMTFYNMNNDGGCALYAAATVLNLIGNFNEAPETMYATLTSVYADKFTDDYDTWKKKYASEAKDAEIYSAGWLLAKWAVAKGFPLDIRYPLQYEVGITPVDRSKLSTQHNNYAFPSFIDSAHDGDIAKIIDGDILKAMDLDNRRACFINTGDHFWVAIDHASLLDGCTHAQAMYAKVGAKSLKEGDIVELDGRGTAGYSGDFRAWTKVKPDNEVAESCLLRPLPTVFAALETAFGELGANTVCPDPVKGCIETIMRSLTNPNLSRAWTEPRAAAFIARCIETTLPIDGVNDFVCNIATDEAQLVAFVNAVTTVYDASNVNYACAGVRVADFTEGSTSKPFAGNRSDAMFLIEHFEQLLGFSDSDARKASFDDACNVTDIKAAAGDFKTIDDNTSFSRFNVLREYVDPNYKPSGPFATFCGRWLQLAPGLMLRVDGATSDGVAFTTYDGTNVTHGASKIINGAFFASGKLVSADGGIKDGGDNSYAIDTPISGMVVTEKNSAKKPKIPGLNFSPRYKFEATPGVSTTDVRRYWSTNDILGLEFTNSLVYSTARMAFAALGVINPDAPMPGVEAAVKIEDLMKLAMPIESKATAQSFTDLATVAHVGGGKPAASRRGARRVRPMPGRHAIRG